MRVLHPYSTSGATAATPARPSFVVAVVVIVSQLIQGTLRYDPYFASGAESDNTSYILRSDRTTATLTVPVLDVVAFVALLVQSGTSNPPRSPTHDHCYAMYAC